MIEALELLEGFQRRGVRLTVEGDRLKYWAPRGALTVADLENLRALKFEIIPLLEQSVVEKPELQPRRGAAAEMLSREQMDWWDSIRRGLYTGSFFVQLPSVMRWRGPLDSAALDQALTAVVARHAIMRTRIVELDEQPFAMVADPEQIHIPVCDLTGLPDAEREATARTMAMQLSQERFASLGERLFRVRLLRLAAEDHVFVAVVHHIITDAQSMSMLHFELQRLYTAIASGDVPTLPAPALQYADYAAWQRSWMTDDLQRVYLARQKHDGLARPMSFPVDATVTTTATPCRVRCPFVLPAELMSAIAKFARSEGTTQHLVVLTAFKIALAQWTCQTRVTLSSIGNLRIEEKLMDMLGLFVSFDLVSTELAGAGSFRDALCRVMQAYAEAQDFRPYAPAAEYVPLVNVLVDYIPEFDVTASARAAAASATSVPALVSEEFPLPLAQQSPMQQWALVLIAHEKAGRLEGRLIGSSNQFGVATLQGALDRFQSILAACVIDGNAPIPTKWRQTA